MTSAPQTTSTRPLWLALFLLTAAVISAAAGLLAYAGGVTVPNAILTGCAAFVGTTGFLIALAHFLGEGR